jgi:hypothetical protein
MARAGAGTGAPGSPSEAPQEEVFGAWAWEWDVGGGHREMIPHQQAGLSRSGLRPSRCRRPVPRFRRIAFRDGDGDGDGDGWPSHVLRSAFSRGTDSATLLPLPASGLPGSGGAGRDLAFLPSFLPSDGRIGAIWRMGGDRGGKRATDDSFCLWVGSLAMLMRLVSSVPSLVSSFFLFGWLGAR